MASYFLDSRWRGNDTQGAPHPASLNREEAGCFIRLKCSLLSSAAPGFPKLSPVLLPLPTEPLFQLHPFRLDRSGDDTGLPTAKEQLLDGLSALCT